MNPGLGGFPVKENVSKWGGDSFVNKISFPSGISGKVTGPVGAVGNPSFNFGDRAGLYQGGAETVYFTAGGLRPVAINSAGLALSTSSTIVWSNGSDPLAASDFSITAETVGSNIFGGILKFGTDGASTNSITLKSADGTTSNSSGAGLSISAGKSRGSGVIGSLVFRTCQFTGGTGIPINPLVDRMVINSSGDINHLSSISFFPSGNTSDTVLGNASFYINKNASSGTYTMPLISSCTGRTYHVKNQSQVVNITGNVSTDYFFTTVPTPSFNILSGEAYVLHNDGQYWSVF